MRCKICNTKFEAKYFLQKTCENPECEKLFREGVLEKSKNTPIKPKNKPLEKKCKGTGKAIGFGCGEVVTERIFGLGKSCRCYSKWLLESNSGAEYLKRITIKVTAPRIELENAQQEKKDRTKLTWLLINVRTVCHDYIKLRDIGKNCVCCGIPYKPDFHASHFYKAELYSNLKYDENNIHSGCQKCNLLLEGNESGFRAGLIQRYGIDFINALDNKAKDYKRNDFHWDRETLQEIRTYYQEKLKILKEINKLK